MTKIDIAALPELNTSVAVHGATQQREVTGAFCLAAVIAAAMLIRG